MRGQRIPSHRLYSRAIGRLLIPAFCGMLSASCAEHDSANSSSSSVIEPPRILPTSVLLPSRGVGGARAEEAAALWDIENNLPASEWKAMRPILIDGSLSGLEATKPPHRERKKTADSSNVTIRGQWFTIVDIVGSPGWRERLQRFYQAKEHRIEEERRADSIAASRDSVHSRL